MDTIKCSVDFDKASKEEGNWYLTINKVDYRLGFLGEIPGNKGGNSWVFKLFDAQDDSLDYPISVIKINKWPYFNENNKRDRRLNKKIDFEIKALYDCRKRNAQYVIEIFEDGILENNDNKYRFYTMEVAESDLKTFMESTPSLNSYDKVKICIELTKALNELSGFDYYHRDIKPDNFFLIGEGLWKIGDLGLVSKRNIQNNKQEFIGPRGWTSPEAMNKYLTKPSNRIFNRFIDEKSDMFQLGMVFWYVMQGNAPIGCVIEPDFLEENHQFYILIRQMISHNKEMRPPSFDFIIDRLNQIANNYLFK
jgi:serine/threonine protein kinase